MHGILLSLTLALCASPDPSPTVNPDEGRVVERLVALIANQPVFYSDVMFEARIALIQKGASPQVQPTDDELPAALQYAITQRLAAREAERLQVYESTDAEVQAQLTRFASHFPSTQALTNWLASHEMTRDQLAMILSRQLRAQRYFESRMPTSTRVGDREAREYYAAHRSAFGTATLAQATPAIGEQILAARRKALLERQLADLSDRYTVRVLR